MVLLLLFVWILCGIGGYHMGKNKKMGSGTGLLLGLLLGLIGLIIIAFSADEDNFEDHDYIIAQSYQKSEEVTHLHAADELQKWHDLKEKGAISAEEFEVRKNNILKRG